jgi:hypothetical protein
MRKTPSRQSFQFRDSQAARIGETAALARLGLGDQKASRLIDITWLGSYKLDLGLVAIGGWEEPVGSPRSLKTMAFARRSSFRLLLSERDVNACLNGIPFFH